MRWQLYFFYVMVKKCIDTLKKVILMICYFVFKSYFRVHVKSVTSWKTLIIIIIIYIFF